MFISYAREDVEWKRRFEVMLKPLVDMGLLGLWSDEREVVGEEWRPQLARAIAVADPALLLVTPSFVASDFIRGQELPAVVEQSIRLVPVVVLDCYWRYVPFLEERQFAIDPEHPIADAGNPERDIRRVCDQLLERLSVAHQAGERAVALPGGPRARARAEPLERGTRLAELYGVPPLPPAFVVREELAGLREAVLRGGDSAVGVTGQAVGFQGVGGIGKTVLAGALAAMRPCGHISRTGCSG